MGKAGCHVERERLILSHPKLQRESHKSTGCERIENREKEEGEQEGKLTSRKHLLCPEKFGHVSPVLLVIYSESMS